MAYTPTQQRLMDRLADGLGHTREDLHSCLDDPLTAKQQVKVALTGLRKVIRPQGFDIVCVKGFAGALHYRLVRLLANAYDGKS